MFTKKFIVSAFVAAILAIPVLSACGHTNHSVAPVPVAVPTEQPPSAVPDSGTGASWSNGASDGSDGDVTSGVPATRDGTDVGSAGTPDSSSSSTTGTDGGQSVNVPDPANTLGVPELPQYDPTLSQIHAIQNQ